MKILPILLLSLIIVLICFAGLGIKILLKRNGEFKRHCAGHDPYTGKSNGCVCASASKSRCKTRQGHPYQPLDVNEELLNEIEGR